MGGTTPIDWIPPILNIVTHIKFKHSDCNIIPDKLYTFLIHMEGVTPIISISPIFCKIMLNFFKVTHTKFEYSHYKGSSDIL